MPFHQELLDAAVPLRVLYHNDVDSVPPKVKRLQRRQLGALHIEREEVHVRQTRAIELRRDRCTLQLNDAVVLCHFVTVPVHFVTFPGLGTVVQQRGIAAKCVRITSSK